MENPYEIKTLSIFLNLSRMGCSRYFNNLIPLFINRIINNPHGDFFGDKYFRSNSTIPPTLKAWHNKEKSINHVFNHAEGVTQNPPMFQPFRLVKGAKAP